MSAKSKFSAAVVARARVPVEVTSKWVMVELDIPDELLSELERMADRSGVTVEALVRSCLHETLAGA